MANRAAFLQELRSKPFKIDSAEIPTPGPDEVVIKNHAVAINPVDWQVQDYGIIIQNFPAVLGTDVAGEVHALGDNVSHVKKGDRVIGHAFSLAIQKPQNGAFQHYTLCLSVVVAKIPSSLSYTSAAVLPLSISTASVCLFKKEALALPYNDLSTSPVSSDNQKKSILVYGGSSSVGCSAIQIARAAGLKVISVCGKHNIEKVKELGAHEVFDHSAASVVDDIIGAAKGTEFVGTCDCIGTPDAIKTWPKVNEKLGGRYAEVVPNAKGLPEESKGATIMAPTVGLTDRQIGEAVWKGWVAGALEKGGLKAKPEPTVIKGGLEKIQEGVDKLRQGISFGKIVVQL